MTAADTPPTSVPTHVVATAGHVDHGKSTLVRRLTGTEPDRLAEERRRGLTIELGYAWTRLAGTDGAPVDLAFVDVPGHERFVTTMLSGVGPVPAVLFVVAADDPWMPQAEEHLAALDALQVRHGVLAVTRADLADPAPARQQALERIGRTTLGEVPAVTVSGRTGEGLPQLRAALAALVDRLPEPDPDADVRLWVDRVFHVHGAGTVVTGTLPAGTVRVGDTLSLGGSRLRVRGLQCLGQEVSEACGVGRVALNLVGGGGRAPAGLRRGAVLVSPGAWPAATVVDVRLSRPGRLPQRPVLHVGATSVGVHLRPLGQNTARLRLPQPLPLRIGDRALLRDPGRRETWGVEVLDPAPPDLRRRGAAADRVAELAGTDGSAHAELGRRGLVRADDARRWGIRTEEATGVVPLGEWLTTANHEARLRAEVRRLVDQAGQDGAPLAEVAATLGLPDPGLVPLLVDPPLRVARGRVLDTTVATRLDPVAQQALDLLRADLSDSPFAAPGADRLCALGLDARTLGVLARAGLVLRLEPNVVLLPGADTEAVEVLGTLRQPFTTSEARAALGTSRRVALALLTRLDRSRLTLRLPDDRRRVLSTQGTRGHTPGATG